MSIHQGAQADRASIALNYSRVSFNFFEPRVMETATREGITPCEFPIVNYTVALFYKIFGYSPFWYRFIMWCLMGIGLWAAFDLLCLWLANKWAAFLISFTWFSSSILSFYTPNFLPDTASLALMLLALRQWFIFKNYPSKSALIWFTLFATLACLVKITSLIFVIAIVSVEGFQFFKKREKPKLSGVSLIVFLLVFGWYYYCQWLEREVGGSYFLMSMAIPSSMAEMKEWFHIFYANWFHQIYYYPQWLFIGLGIISVPFIKEKTSLKLFAALALTGALCIYFLMAGQFRYHDYYSITLLPVFLFFMAFGFKWLFSFSPFIAFIAILLVGVWGFIYAKNNFRLRYTPGEYLYQTFFEPNDFKKIDQWLTQNGVTPNHKILAAFDPNPNTLLYFLNRRGCRTFDHPVSYVEGKLRLYPHLITNDSVRFFKQYPDCRKQIILKSSLNKWLLYQLK
ncbi:MAG: ArnT family glycosyltransferase [Bacteroidia bacterium]